jgi:hypothetical protein
MEQSVFPTGNRVRVTSYGPFRGLEGTIQRVDTLADDLEDPFCFYLIALQGATIQEPIWFEYDEVECIGFPASALHAGSELTRVGPAQY